MHFHNVTTDPPAFTTWPAMVKGDDLWLWQEGRCAMCSLKSAGGLVLDHDHETGLTRGYLCRRCNRMEAHSTAEGWVQWRQGVNPCATYDVAEPYNGFGWVDGVDVMDRAFAAEASGWTDEDTIAALDKSMPPTPATQPTPPVPLPVDP